MTYQYEVNTYPAEDSCVTLKTNTIHLALSTLMEARANCVPCEIIDGFTGEVLAHFNIEGTEDYITPLWAYVIYGWSVIHNE